MPTCRAEPPFRLAATACRRTSPLRVGNRAPATLRSRALWIRPSCWRVRLCFGQGFGFRGSTAARPLPPPLPQPTGEDDPGKVKGRWCGSSGKAEMRRKGYNYYLTYYSMTSTVIVCPSSSCRIGHCHRSPLSKVSSESVTICPCPSSLVGRRQNTTIVTPRQTELNGPA